jgi:HD-like signal output (HDOD) protein
MTQRILFVDDDPNVLQGVRRMLHRMRHEWDMAFAENGHEALELMACTPFDVVVSDMRMPGMDGTQLLTEVKQRYPHIVRIILSGQSDRETILRSVEVTHQFLAKPCDAEMLKSTIARACALRDLLADETLKQLVAGIQTLPSLPTLYLEVVEAVQAPDSSLEQVGKIIEQDMGMTAKILQLVNSAFFGLRRQVSGPVEAVGLLGLDTIQALILSIQVFANFDQAEMGSLSIDALWSHSMAVSALAKRIAKAENCKRKVIDDAFMAGLLHDVGKLVLAANLPQDYDQALALAQAEGMAEWEAERATLGATHAEVGAYLLGLWGLPEPMVEALAFHHCPSACPHHTFGPLTAVHVANALMREDDAADATEPSVRVDGEYLAALGLGDRLARWREDYQSILAEGSRA